MVYESLEEVQQIGKKAWKKIGTWLRLQKEHIKADIKTKRYTKDYEEGLGLHMLMPS